MSARLSIRTVAVRKRGEDRRRAGHDNEENAIKQYLLSVHHVGDFPTPAPEVLQEMFAQVEEFNEQLRQSGAWVFAGGLQPRESSTTVRYKQGQTLVTDGPFAETKEQLGGFWVVQAADLDAALELAKRGAAACQGDVEVRAFQAE
jgi:hypothetical protein